VPDIKANAQFLKEFIYSNKTVGNKDLPIYMQNDFHMDDSKANSKPRPNIPDYSTPKELPTPSPTPTTAPGTTVTPPVSPTGGGTPGEGEVTPSPTEVPTVTPTVAPPVSPTGGGTT
jgi:hypothetical protein